MTTSSRHSAGYRAVFDPPLDKKHECPLCLCALRDPIQTPCGHRFCTDCIKGILKKPCPRCPLDDEQINRDKIFPDNFCKREMLELYVLCLNKDSGCSWRGPLKKLELHKASCEYIVVECSNSSCDCQVIQRDLQTHLQRECNFRRATCHLCGQEFVFESEKHHVLVDCIEVPVLCENGCGELVKRKDYSYHLKVCQEVLKQFGHQFERGNSALGVNKSALRLQHLDMLQTQGKSLPSPSVSGATSVVERGKPGHSYVNDTAIGSSIDEFTAMKQRIRDLELIVNDWDKTIIDQTKIISDQRKAISDKNEAIKDLLRTVSYLIEEDRQESSALRQEFAAVNHRHLVIEKNLETLRNKAVVNHDARLRSLETVSYNEVLKWKITEFSQKRSEAVAGTRTFICSNPFLTHMRGYKMCARICLNGNGIGEGSHLGFFIQVMKGEFDDFLPWPFQQKVTFTLIDQDHLYDYSDTFRPDLLKSTSQHPVNEMNVASGCPLFVPLEMLTTQGYIKDDTMFIQVSVDTKNLGLLE